MTRKTIAKRHRVLIERYLTHWNGTKAAIEAGYSPRSARSTAAEILAKPSIQAEIQARIAEMRMSTDEALVRLADMARSDLGDFMDISSVGFSFDLKTAREKGLTKLIKKVRQKTTTRIGRKQDDDDIEVSELEIELYSAQDALNTILKAGGKLTENTINIVGLSELLDKAYEHKPTDNPST